MYEVATRDFHSAAFCALSATSTKRAHGRSARSSSASSATRGCPGRRAGRTPYSQSSGEIGAAQWRLADEALRGWADEQWHDPKQLSLTPEDLGVRITYLSSETPSETSGPTCDFAVPFA
jgi:hypothetical protein